MKQDDIPFSAAIFDLDGTLLDSTWVWREVDRAFFAALGMEEPADYARSIQGMSFRETAAYTVARFSLSRTVEEVMEGWMRETRAAYAHRVALKPGARSYLRRLKQAGVRLAVATANREELFAPTLKRWGVWELFDAVCTSAQVGDAGKGDGTLFRLAAEKLGADPGDCAVFEDTLEGIRGARAAGMTAYALQDPGNDHHREAIAALASAVVRDFTEMERVHRLPGERRCVIFTACFEGDPDWVFPPEAEDHILCADGGWTLARRMGVKTDLVIGDFDSAPEPEGVPTRRHPREKDDTDTMLCLKQGLAMGFEDFLIVGGIGGRLDHTLANLQALHYAANLGARAVLWDGWTWAAVVADGERTVPVNVVGPGPVKLSVFALSDRCDGVTIRGTRWPMEGGTLTNAFPLGVSNVILGESAAVGVQEGTLLVMVCRDDGGIPAAGE